MFLYTICALVAAIITLIYVWLQRRYRYWERKGVFHEKPVWILGNMKGIGKTLHFRDIDQRLYEKFKGKAPFIGLYTFLSPVIFILDLDLIKTILIKDFHSCSNRDLFHNVRDDPLTGNLLFVDGRLWSELRHKLLPVFTTGKLRYMFPTMAAVADRLVETCELIVQENQGAIEAKDLCARYTTDVIGVCAFGIECNSLHDPEAEFRRMGRQIFEYPRHTLPVQIFMFNDPTLARKLRMKNFRDDTSAFFMNAVAKTVEYREKNNIKRQDFMDLMIDLKAKHDASNPGTTTKLIDNLNNGLSLEQVAAQAMMFFLAGFDTSSTTMSFCIYELAINPDVQERLRTEILTVMKRYDGILSYDSVKEMVYLDKVISETLRKYSVLPHIVRQTSTEYVLPNSNVRLPKGMRILIPIDAIHNDPEYYPNPERFDPERFNPEIIAQRPSFAYLPFGDGPRNCIGMRFGRCQVQIGIITLLRHFRFTTTKDTQIPIQFSLKAFLLAPKDGIHLQVDKLS